MVQSQTKKKNALHDLGYKIFLDRYALKDMKRETLAVGDLVIVVVNSATGQREVGRITAMQLPQVTIELLDGELVTRDIEHVDKPLETDPAQMMDRVATGIAAVEKTTKKRREWADKFRWLLEDWKFVPGGRILTAAGTDQELTFYNCMPPEQEILTADGYKPIADVRVGDLVVTHKNRLRPVLHKFERETEEDIYTITTKKIGYDVLRVTGEHKIHVIRSEWVNADRRKNGLRLSQEPAWIPANQLKKGDFVAVAHDGEICPPATIRISDYLPNYRVQEGQLFKPTTRGEHGYVSDWGTHFAINNDLELDADLCFLFGRWLGDGCVTHRTKSDIPSGIKIVFSLDERHEAEQIAGIIRQKFGIEPALETSSTGRWLDLWVNSMLIGEFFKAFFGAYSHSKHIPTELMHMEGTQTCALLHGLFSSDGYISEDNIGILLANQKLCVQIHQLLLRLGYFFTIFENTHKNGRVASYRLTAPASEARDLFHQFFNHTPQLPDTSLRAYFEYDGLRWVPIDSITTENYRGIVMDIEVEEDHSFVSAGLVVSNCYVIPMVGDSRGGIIETLGNMTEIMSRGGGVGINLSTLRPRHAYVKGVNGRSSGSVSWGALYSFVTGLIEQGGSRRGALMLILNDWHPDIFDFVNSKREAGKITNANISVGLSDRFMDAMKADADWHLQFPDTSHPDYDTLWDGDLEKWMASGRPVITYKTIKAKDLWNAIIESAWASAEPGIWFRERSNKMSNSWYFNPLIATNPCGEQPLSAYSVCNLGAINLAKFYDEEKHDVAWDDLERTVAYAIRFLDNVIDTTPYFFEENRKVQLAERRVGLGTMGVAELMIKLHIRYGSDESVEFIDKLYKFMAVHAYKTSSAIAKEKGSFPQFDPEKFLQSGFMADMPADVREQIRKDGIRNVTLLTQAPTGTTGTMVNTSTGIEPFFSWVYYRKSRLGLHEEKVPIVQDWYAENPHADELPDYFVTAMDLTPMEHVKVQGAFQKWIDSAISKTANLPNNYTVQQTAELYEYMYALGCKGGTIYRDGSRDEQVLMLKGDERAEKENEAKSRKEDKVEQVATPHRVYPRPKKLHGVTVNTQTPFGTAYITMNSDEQGYPFEVFITAPGKAGSDLQADAEGLGRMISLSLRTTEPHNRREMLRLIIDQLRDIGGARSIGFGIERVISLPDAVARALEDHYFPKSETLQLQIPMMDVGIGKSSSQPKLLSSNGHDRHHEIEVNYSTADLCPSCGTISLVRAEGCRRCLTCDYTEC
jgi:ribonucleoside-diphosphate reductase alpha chain